MNDQERSENKKRDISNNRLNKLENQVESLREKLSRIHGKLDGKQQSDAASWGKIAIVMTVISTVIALLAYFK